MKRLLVPLTVLAALSIAGSPAFAQKGRGPGAGPHGPAMSPGSGHGTMSPGSGKNSSLEMRRKSPDEILAHNTKLSDKLGSLLPKGMTPQQACSGFKNLGQCVAAIHVAHNLGIDFNCLKADMTGTPPAGSTCAAGTGSKKLSLGRSIETLKPRADSKSESRKAMKQADQDFQESEPSS